MGCIRPNRTLCTRPGAPADVLPRTADPAVMKSITHPGEWKTARDPLFDMWLQGVDNPKVIRLVREVMGSYGFEVWARAGQEMAAGYRREGSPLTALASLRPPVPVLHLYVQRAGPEFLHAQEMFAAANPWFTVRKLNAKSHFPMLEVPGDLANLIESLLAQR